MITNELRDKFKKLYYEKFSITLSDEEATAMTVDLVNLMKVLLKSNKTLEELPVSPESPHHEAIRVQHYQQPG